jgi:hypothetical protein
MSKLKYTKSQAIADHVAEINQLHCKKNEAKELEGRFGEKPITVSVDGFDVPIDHAILYWESRLALIRSDIHPQLFFY